MRDHEIDLLLVEDDDGDAFLTRKLLSGQDAYRFNVLRAPTLASGISLLSRNPDVVLLDLSLPDATGWETFSRFLGAAPHTPIVLLTGCDDEDLGMRAIHEGAQDYIPKRDLTATLLPRCVRYAIERKKTEEKLQNLAEELRARNTEVAEELELARDVQEAFIPTQYPCFPADVAPERSALRFAHVYRSSRQLGGDFFGVQAISDTAACVFICDVMGHGVRSALVMATIRGLLEETDCPTREPARLLTELNRALRAVTRRPGQLVFASAACLSIDLREAEASCAIAGHPAPIRLSAGGSGAWLRPADAAVEPALGLFAGQEFTATRHPLSPGDRLLLFTDGLHECLGADNELYGRQRLLSSAETHSGLSLPELLAALVDDAAAFHGRSDFEDDVCLLGIGVNHLSVNVGDPAT